ncbi:MAG: geranylgeranylglycerol-phosphate geranylgeranyltransferase [Prevotellaceae bacterium]|jgi:4-hydroxybenzoate polyprenyltransferase|nr:geranylgeranylglycerol-phosphate geranylgeranyltransferase [Prevotellaceae bacterium]
MDFLRLIRYKNLIFIAALQWVVFYTVIIPITKLFQIEPDFVLSGLQFGLLVLSTVLIAAGGYVINDYFDTRIDGINRPDRVIVGKSISKKQASLIHQISTALGIVSGLFVAWQCRSFSVAIVVALIPGLLWFYSASYKRQFLVGNIVIALCAGFVPLIVVLASVENLTLPAHFGDLIRQTPIPQLLYTWVCGFSVFAFLLTLIREIIKDLEDQEGDREMESRSLPIILGETKTKIVLYALIAIMLGLLFFVWKKFIADFPLFVEDSSLALRYIIFGLALPLAYLLYLLAKANTPTKYHQAATFCKFVMVIGMLFGFIFYFLLAQGQGIAMFDLFMVNKDAAPIIH